MSNIFTTKMVGKTNLELIHILLNAANYQDLAVEAARYELIVRKIVNSQESSEEYTSRLQSLKLKLLDEERRKRLVQQTPENTPVPSAKYDWSWMKWTDFFHLVWFYCFGIALYMLTRFPFMHDDWGLLFSIWVCIGIWQVSLSSTPKRKRAYHLYGRITSAFFVTLLVSYLNWINGNDAINWNFLTLFLLVLALTGFPSVIIYNAFTAKWHSSKLYFLNRLKIPAVLSLIFLLGLSVIQKQLFVSDELLPWDEHRPIEVSDFRGFPDLLTHFDGAITSGFDYQFEGESLKYLNAVCYTHETWINPWDKDSYFLLQHERYHFNITEVVARMARKAIAQSLKSGHASKEDLLEIIGRHNLIKNEMQDQYDEETDHSTIEDQQGLWQNKIDSLLIELDPYWTTSILNFADDSNDSITFYRDFLEDALGVIHPIDPLLPGEELYTGHYRVKIIDESTRNISSWFQGRRMHDPDLGSSSLTLFQTADSLVIKHFDTKGNPSVNKLKYHQSVTTFNGNDIVRMYLDQSGNRMVRSDGVYLRKGKVDSLGRLVNISSANKAGQAIATESGYHSLFFEYDSSCQFSKNIQNYGPEGNPYEDAKGYHIRQLERDSVGRMLKFAPKNKLNMSPDFYHSINWKYDELGRLVEKYYLDADGALVQGSDGVARVTWADDRYGNVSRKSTYNRHNVLVNNDEGYATIYRSYDSANNQTLWAEYDSGNRVVFDDNGYAKVKYESDHKGRWIHLINYNGYDYPIKSSISGRIERRIYDSTGLIMRGEFYDRDGNPEENSDGAISYLVWYDSAGNELMKEFYGSNELPRAVNKDVARFRYTYDKSGNKLEARFYNEYGTLAQGNGGISINRYKYSSENRMIERSYYDSLERLARFEGAAIVRYDYDESGNTILIRKFDVDEELLDSGVAIVEQKYNQKNQCTVRINKTADELLITSGIARTLYRYDDEGNIIDEFYFNYRGEPIANENRIHHLSYRYSNKRLIEKSHYDPYGELVEQNEDNSVVKYQYKRDDFGNVIEETRIYYSNSEFKINLDTMIINFEYDLYDRIISTAYFNQKYEPVLYSDSFHQVAFVRHASGDVLVKKYFDKEGQLTENKDGVAMETNYYSLNGAKTTTTFNLEEAKSQIEKEQGK